MQAEQGNFWADIFFKLVHEPDVVSGLELLSRLSRQDWRTLAALDHQSLEDWAVEQDLDPTEWLTIIRTLKLMGAYSFLIAGELSELMKMAPRARECDPSPVAVEAPMSE
jgi:hypothetical protein